MMTDDCFSEYLRLLTRLHELIAQGRGDADEADVIRDQMDWPWSQLNRRQIELADGLSSDLSTLGTNRTATEFATTSDDEFCDAVQRQDWESALRFVRKREQSLAPANVAFLRGAVWLQLNQPKIALKFLEESARIKPPDAEHEIWHLRCLVQSDRAVDAVPRARELLETSSNLLVRCTALQVLFFAAYALPDPKRRAMLIESCRLAETLLSDSLWSTPPLGTHPQLQLGLWQHLAIGYLELDDREKATHACIGVLQIQPDYRSALELLGFLNYPDFPQEERGPFVRRLQRESSHVFNYAPLTLA